MATSNAKTAYVTVTVFDGRSSVEDDADNAAFAVAEWLDTQDTTTLAGDHDAYMIETLEDADPTDAASRYKVMLHAAWIVASKAATAGWATPSGASVMVEITPHHVA